MYACAFVSVCLCVCICTCVSVCLCLMSFSKCNSYTYFLQSLDCYISIFSVVLYHPKGPLDKSESGLGGII